jgi:hypothetical protein
MIASIYKRMRTCWNSTIDEDQQVSRDVVIEASDVYCIYSEQGTIARGKVC